MINCSFFKVQRYNFIFIYKLFTSLFYHSHIISPQKPHLSLSNSLFSNILISVLSPSYLRLIFVHSSFILRSFFVHSSSILRPFFVHSSSIPHRPYNLHLPVRLAPACVAHTFPSLPSPSPWERVGERILFLSPRNLVFNIFSLVVLYYESTFYIPFLYQSSKIRISFL